MGLAKRALPLFLAALAGCATPARADEALGNGQLGTPVKHDKLTIIPLLARSDPKADKDREFLVLDEGFEQKKVKISEQQQESVNTLALENNSDKPLFLMAGEVVLGGKQDRIIGKDTVIEPHAKTDIPVY